MKGLPPALSKDVSAVVEGYTRREVAPDGSGFTVTAARATTFTDNHQELDGVKIEFPSLEGADALSATKAIFIPAAGGAFKVFLQDEVVLASADGLTMTTSAMVYDNGTGIGTTDGAVEFRRRELTGLADGARFNSLSRVVDFLGRVSVTGVRSTEGGAQSDLATLGVRRLDLTGERGSISTKERTLALENGVSWKAEVEKSSEGIAPDQMTARSLQIRFDGNRPIELKLSGAPRAIFLPTTARKQKLEANGDSLVLSLKQGEESIRLDGAGKITVTDTDGSVTSLTSSVIGYRISSGEAFAEGEAKLEREVNGRKQTASSRKIDFSSTTRKFSLVGNARFESSPDFFRAERISGVFDGNQELKSLVGDGDSALGRDDMNGRTETTAKRFEATFGSGQLLRVVNVSGPARTTHRSKSSKDWVSVMDAPRGMRVEFDAKGQASNARTQGRTTIKLSDVDVGNRGERTITADEMRVVFNVGGQSLRTAEARGKAEIVLLEQGGSTRINSTDFICNFAFGTNRAERCDSSSKGTVSRSNNGENQSMESSRLSLFFDTDRGEADSIQAEGKARFSQAASGGIADRIVYRFASGAVSMIGQPVQFWDARGRSRSRSVEWNTRQKTVTMDGQVSTTYYNRKQAGDSVPFREAATPVYVTAARSIIRENGDSVTFEGGARLWQKDNFISANSIEIQRDKKILIASGDVRTLLFDVPRQPGSSLRASVSGSSGVFRYDDSSRVAVYRSKVEIRQGQERLQAEQIAVGIGPDGQVNSFSAEGSVILSQPGRKATGKQVEYSLSDRKVTLKGSPARVVESGRGATEGGTLTYFVDDRKVVGEGKTENDSKGKVRSVYQVDRE